MNIYPAALEPTLTPPDSDTAAGQRATGFFGAALWPGGYPGRAELLRLRTPLRRPMTPIKAPVIVDRETGRTVTKPSSVSRIGHWTQLLEDRRS